MKIKNLIFMLCIAFVAPALVADQTEVEIQLVEISGAVFLPGDNPLDSPVLDDDLPHPEQFRVTITGSLLSVTADNSNLTRVIVRNSAGNIVLNRQFVGGTMEQLGTTGNHSIEIQNGGMTLVGMFSAF
ncbi:MAG: hypothetical protein IJT35_08550 [Paludibacteraceae bacterium]|nr:hypothetical protein [Paludibacteraceae bacterium]